MGLNAHLLSLGRGYRSAGITWYIYNLLSHLPGIDSEFHFTAFSSEKKIERAPGINTRISRLPTHVPAVRIAWEQLVQPWAIRHARVDLVHGMAFVGPVVSGCPSLVTVHDLSFLFFPSSFRAVNRLYLKLFARWSVKRARRVIAVSDSTRRDVIEQYEVEPDRVDVVYNGVDPSFHTRSAAQVAAFRTKRGLPERYILFVGTLEPRKNIDRLIRAYAQLPHGCPPLLLIGGKGWFYEHVFALVEELRLGDRVHFAGYAPADELPLWYNAAELFVYPSLYEGFGLPPLEAMACGTPVITSTASSLPEVVGDAGMLVDPLDTEALAQAMERALADRDLRARLKAAGAVRARGFSWQETARGTLGSYRRALALEGGTPSV